MPSNAYALPAAASPHGLWIPIHVCVVASVLLPVAFVFDRRLYELSTSHTPITLGCGLAVLALIAYTRYGLKFAWLSASIVYLALFWMFHFGLTFTALMAPSVLEATPNWEIAWMQWPNVRVAMLLGLIGASGFVFGAGIAGDPAAPTSATADSFRDDAMFVAGWGIMIAGLAASLLVLVLSGGTAVFAMSYLEVRQQVLAVLQTYIDMAQVGCLLALCGAGGRRWVLPLSVFSVFAAVLLIVGLRTQAMVSMVMFAIVLSHRGVRFRGATLTTAVLLSLVLIPAVRVLRTVGVANRQQVNWTAISPLETFVELGGTLRAVRAYVDLFEGENELLWGATYWAPFDRQVLDRIIPGRERTSYDDDVRLPERTIEREGAIGTSATGEAYANFGAAGPFIYFSCVGFLFGWLERRAPTGAYYSAALGVAMSVFFFNIRGAWLSMPAHIAAGALVLSLCYACNHIRRR